MNFPSFDTDVFVVGGGPAGLAAAIAARQRGFRVMVADGAKPPVDKACGEGLMPDGVAALRALGVDPAIPESHPFRGIRFIDKGSAVDASFPGGPGLGIRRVLLHQLLLDQAAATGVSMMWGTPVTGIARGRITSARGEFRPRWIVGADGGNSMVRRWAALERCRDEKLRFAFRRHYRVAPWSDCMEIYWGSGCQIYITAVSASEVCAVVMAGRERLRVDAALACFPELAARLQPGFASSAERGAVTATRRLARVYRDNVALVGDASGSVDAITGEGMCLAFKHARLLADSLEQGNLEPYQARHRRAGMRPGLMARVMLSMEDRDRTRHRAVRALALQPDIFADLLAMHVGHLSVARGARAGVRLGFQLIAA